MCDVSLWIEVMGVEKTAFEAAEFDQEQDLCWLGCGPGRGCGVVALCD